MSTDRPHGWDDLIVFVGGERWDGVRGSHRHLAEALARRRPVLYVDNPVSPLSARRSGPGATPRPGLRQIGPRLAVVVPGALPGLSRPGIRRTTDALTRRAIRRALRQLGRPHVAATIVASLDDVLTCCGADRRLVYATDDYVAGASLMNIGAGHLRRQERRQARRADGVFVVSEDLADRWRALGHDPLLLPNGCDPSAYTRVDAVAPAAQVTLEPPIAGVVGRISARIDLALLEAVAERGRSLLLIGPVDPTFEPERFARLVARPNVQATGAVDFDDLPGHLATVHTGLTPYADSAFNRASFPLKTLEYLAAGRAVVATDLPAHRWLDTDLVALATGPEAFADAVDASLPVTTSRALAARRRSFARRHSWDERAGELDAWIAGSGPPAAAVRTNAGRTADEGNP